MNAIEQAIRDAVEKGGYEPYKYHFNGDAESIKELEAAGPAPKTYLIEYNEDGDGDFECPHPIVVMRWHEESDPRVNDENSHVGFTPSAFFLDPAFWQALAKARGWGIEPSGSIWQGQEKWLIYWHRFIDHLAEGHNAESFFASLLTQSE